MRSEMTANKIEEFITKLDDYIREYNLIDNPTKDYHTAQTVLDRAKEYVISENKELQSLFISCSGGPSTLLIDSSDGIFTIKHFKKDMPTILERLREKFEEMNKN